MNGVTTITRTARQEARFQHEIGDRVVMVTDFAANANE
jgi:hypothetical protein